MASRTFHHSRTCDWRTLHHSTTGPVPIDAGHLVTSGITETNYTDCGKVNGSLA